LRLSIKSQKRGFEIDILRATAILLIVLAMIPQQVVSYTSPFSLTSDFVPLTSFAGLSIFFFVSGYSLYFNNKTVNNVKDAFNFYKKRFFRIYPLYWVFVAGLVIFNRLSLAQTLIYITGLEAFFYPIFISTVVFHFVSTIIVFYLLFPLIVHFDDYDKMLIVSVIPLLFFAIILHFNVSDTLLLGYYSVFVGGIIAAKANLCGAMREVKFNTRMLALTIFFFVAPLSLLMWERNYFNSTVLLAFLNGLCSIPVVLVMLYWAVVYVGIFNTKFRAIFTFVAFSTFGVYFIYEPFFKILGNSLYVRFSMTGAAASTVLLVFIPLLVMIGYLLQLLTNELVNSALLRFRRSAPESG
jgi:peptidoglycan/LPS O-acetylase OafA/YrhL